MTHNSRSTKRRTANMVPPSVGPAATQLPGGPVPLPAHTLPETPSRMEASVPACKTSLLLQGTKHDAEPGAALTFIICFQ